jgi:hypothetical protein
MEKTALARTGVTIGTEKKMIQSPLVAEEARSVFSLRQQHEEDTGWR